jgi:hypothetical protein
MLTILKNAAISILCLFLGGGLNMLLIMISGFIIPPPPGSDLTTMEGLLVAMPKMGPEHFIFPFLAHAAGTWLSAYLVTKFIPGRGMVTPMIFGALFFIGGYMSVMELPSPMWFNILDLGVAYFPMALLGYKMAFKKDDKYSH